MVTNRCCFLKRSCPAHALSLALILQVAVIDAIQLLGVSQLCLESVLHLITLGGSCMCVSVCVLVPGW